MGWATFAAVVLASSAASAQSQEQRQQQQQQQRSSSSSQNPMQYNPQLVFGLQAGVGGNTAGLGHATIVGPNWQFRAGFQPFQWISVGANYNGGWNAGRDEVVGARARA